MACSAGSRDRLERLCRYVTRPAIALERLSPNRRGEVLLALKRPFQNGTTHLKFLPEDFPARLAALLRAIHGAHPSGCPRQTRSAPADRWFRGRARA